MKQVSGENNGKWITTVTKQFGFDAAHRVLGHEGKCRDLHGHRYEAFITITAPELDKLGRSLDFGVIKHLVGLYINDCLDHNTILNPHDALASLARIADRADRYSERMTEIEDIAFRVFGRRPIIMPAHYPSPTAENIARLITEECIKIFETGMLGGSQSSIWVQNRTQMERVTIVGVRLYETPTSFADYRMEQ